MICKGAPMAGDRNQAKAARLHRLSLLLRSRSYSLDELAEEFGKDRRTIQRDLAHLREWLGCQLEPRDGRYQLDSEGYLTPPPLTVEEMWALFLACRTLARRGTFPEAAKTALEKLRGSAQSITRRTLVDLEEAVEVGPDQHAFSSEYLRLTLEAYRRRESIDIEYRSIKSSQAVARRLDPWGVFFLQDHWYVVGFDHLRGEQRTFKLARIQSLKLSGVKHERPRDFEPGSAVFHSFDVGDAPPQRVLLKVTPELARLLEENPGHPTQRVEGELVELQVKAPLRMLRWLLGLGNMEVLEPPELRAALAAEARSIADRHTATRDPHR